MTPREKWLKVWYAAAGKWIREHPKPKAIDRVERQEWGESKERFRQQWQRENPSPPLTAGERGECNKLIKLNSIMTGQK